MTDCFTKVVATKVEPSYICESIAAYKDKVLIGTKQGYILVYSISYRSSDFVNLNSRTSQTIDRKVVSEFCFLIRDFNKKPVVQIEVIEDFGIILSLSDNKIYVNRLNDYRNVHILEGLKSIHKFTVEVYDPTKLDVNAKKKHADTLMQYSTFTEAKLTESIMNDNRLKDTNLDCRLCVVTKTKLYIYKWNQVKNTFDQFDKDYKLSVTVKSIQFFHDNLFIGTKNEYFLINIESGEVKALCNVGKCQEPFAFPIAEMMAFKIDESTEFIDRDCKFQMNNTLRWSLTPTSIIYHPPFVIALFNKLIEIRLVSPSMLLQTIQIECATLICRYMDRIYVMMENNKLYCLVSTPRLQLVQVHSDQEDFELALILAKTAPLVGEKPIDCTRINIHYSKTLFRNREFDRAFKIFCDIEVDPTDILCIFPDLCSETFLKDHVERNWSRDFSEEEKTAAIRGFMEYLVKCRSRLRKEDREYLNYRSMNNGKFISKSLKQLQNLVDTSLLKCYLILKSPLVAPLLRQENYCHLDETKKWLQRYEKYQELILLFQNNECHSDALKLLHSQSVKTHSPLEGLSPTIEYLKNLDSNHLDLVYLYGNTILEKKPLQWLSIFSHWDHKIKNYPEENKTYPPYKERLLRHLQNKAPNLVLIFIECIIFQLPESIDLEELSLPEVLSSTPKPTKKLSTGKFYAFNVTSNQPLYLIPLPEIDNIVAGDKAAKSLNYELPLLQSIDDANKYVLHTVYAVELIKQILRRRSINLLCMNIHDELSLPEGQLIFRLRSRLKLLVQSQQAEYDPSKILSELPYDALYEERAAVLARNGKHELALTLWVHQFNNYSLAEKHCNEVYPTQPDIYFKLLSVTAQPCDPSEIGIVISPMNSPVSNETLSTTPNVSNNKFEPKKELAVRIMQKYHDKLDVASSVQLLSNFFTVNDLIVFLQNALRLQTKKLNQMMLQRNIQFYNKLASNLRVCIAAHNYFTLTENSVCGVCKKLIATGNAVARYPQGLIVHYGCCQNLPDTTGKSAVM